MAESINIVCHVKMKGKNRLNKAYPYRNQAQVVLSHTLRGPVCGPVNGYNYRGNFHKNGPINDDDSRHSQNCGVCVDIRGHRLHTTGATPQQS
jgi:hypothetical protein